MLEEGVFDDPQPKALFGFHSLFANEVPGFFFMLGTLAPGTTHRRSELTTPRSRSACRRRSFFWDDLSRSTD